MAAPSDTGEPMPTSASAPNESLGADQFDPAGDQQDALNDQATAGGAQSYTGTNNSTSDAITSVDIGVRDGSIETAISENPIYANVAQITAPGSAFSWLGVAATGGNGELTFTWTVTETSFGEGGAATTTTIMENVVAGKGNYAQQAIMPAPEERNPDNPDYVKIAKVKLDIFADTSLNPHITDGKQYTFTCVVTDQNGHRAVADPIYLFTVDNENNPDKYDDVYGENIKHSDKNVPDGTPGVDHDKDISIEGGLINKDAEVTADKLGRDPETGKDEIEDIYSPIQAEAGAKDKVLGDVWEVDLTVPEDNAVGGPGSPTVPGQASLDDNLTINIPLDKDKGPFTDGGKQEVFWTDADGTIRVIEGTIHTTDKDGNPLDAPYVSVTFPFPILDDNGNVVNRDPVTGEITPEGKPVPSVFAVAYPAEAGDLYTVNAKSQTLTSSGADAGVVGGQLLLGNEPKDTTGTPSGTSVVETTNRFPNNASVRYQIVTNNPKPTNPDAGTGEGSDGDAADPQPLSNYQLESLTVTYTGGTATLVSDFEVNIPDYVKDYFEVTPDKGSFIINPLPMSGAVYSVVATFRDQPPADVLATWHIDVVSEKDFYAGQPGVWSDSKQGKVAFMYYDGKNFVLKPDTGYGESIVVTDVPGSSILKDLRMQPNAPYSPTGLRMKTSADGEWSTLTTPSGAVADMSGVSPQAEEIWLEVCFGTPQAVNPDGELEVVITPGTGGSVWNGTDYQSTPYAFKYATGVAGQTITLKADEGYMLADVTGTFVMAGEVKNIGKNQFAIVDNGDGTYTVTLPAGMTVPFKVNPRFVSEASLVGMTVVTKGIDAAGKDLPGEAGGTWSSATLTDGKAIAGTDQRFLFVPKRGFELESLTIKDASGNDISGYSNPLPHSNGNLTVVAPDVASTLTATFKQVSGYDPNDSQTFVVNAQAVESADGQVHGKVIPAGQTYVRANSSVPLSFVPDPGYRVSKIEVKADPTSAPLASYTEANASATMNANLFVLENVTANRTVEVTFELADPDGNPPTQPTDPENNPNDFTNITVVVPDDIEGGSVSPSGTIEVPKGGQLPITFPPDPGYEFGGAVITVKDKDGNVVDTITVPKGDPSVIIDNLPEGGTVEVFPKFEKDEDGIDSSSRFMLNVTTTGSGKVVPGAGTVLVPKGDQMLTFIPDDGQKLSGASFYLPSDVVVLYSVDGAYMRFAKMNTSLTKPAAGTDEKVLAGANSSTGSQKGASISAELLKSITDHNSRLELRNVLSDVTLTAAFSKLGNGESSVQPTNTHTIEAKVTKGIGSISPAGVIKVQDGASQTVVMTPITGYKIGDIKVQSGNWFADIWNNITGATADAVETAKQSGYFTLTDIKTDYNVEVEFVLDDGYRADQDVPGFDERPVTVLAGEHGKVSPNGVVMVKRPAEGEATGGTQTFVVTPDEGYKIGSITGTDGIQVNWNAGELTFSVTAVPSATDPASTASWVTVEFVKLNSGEPKPELPAGTKVHTVSISAQGHGVVSPLGSVDIIEPNEQVIWMLPEAGYQVDHYTVDGEVRNFVAPSGGFRTIAPNANGEYPHEIVVYFTQKDAQDMGVTIEGVTAAGNGTVSPGVTRAVPFGKYQTLTLQPGSGYKVGGLVTEYFDAEGNVVMTTNETGEQFYADNPTRNTVAVWANSSLERDGVVLIRVSATFVPSNENPPDKYQTDTITVSTYVLGAAAEQGVVSPSGQIEIEKGSTLTLTYSVSNPELYEIYDVKVRTTSVGGFPIAAVGQGQAFGSHTLEAKDTQSNLKFMVYVRPNDKPITSDTYLRVEATSGGTVTVDGLEGTDTPPNAPDARQMDASGHASAEIYNQGSSTYFPVVKGETYTTQIKVEEGMHIKKMLLSECDAWEYEPNPFANEGEDLSYMVQVEPDAQNPMIYVEFSPQFKQPSLDLDDPLDYPDADKVYPLRTTINTNVLVDNSVGGIVDVDTVKSDLGLKRLTDILMLTQPGNGVRESDNDTTVNYKIPSVADGIGVQSLRFEVSPLINGDAVYTIDSVTLADGTPIAFAPTDGKITDIESNGPGGDSSARNASGNEASAVMAYGADGAQYYNSYEFTLPSYDLVKAGEEGNELHINLRQVTGADPTRQYVNLTTEWEGDGSLSVNGTTATNGGSQAVQVGTDARITWQPGSGLVLKSLTVGGVDVTGEALANGYYNYRPLASQANTEVAVKAVFDSEANIPMHTITFSAVGQGTVTLGGVTATAGQGPKTAQVRDHGLAQFTLKPASGYRVSGYNWNNNGFTSYSYTTLPMSDIKDDASLVVTFVPSGQSGGNNGGLSQTGQNLSNAANSALSQTGDRPWLLVGLMLIVVAVACLFVARRLRAASATASAQAAQERAWREYRNGPWGK